MCFCFLLQIFALFIKIKVHLKIESCLVRVAETVLTVAVAQKATLNCKSEV